MINLFKQKNKKNSGRKILNKAKAFTLVETLVAIAIFSMSILSLMAVLANGLSATTYAKTKTIATYLAQEGIESVRNMRDDYVLYPTTGRMWNDSVGTNGFVNKITQCGSGTSCGINSALSPVDPNFISLCVNLNQCKIYTDNIGYYTYLTGLQTGSDSGFIREIRIVAINSNEIQIISTVNWKQGSGNYNVSLSEDLFNWTQ